MTLELTKDDFKRAEELLRAAESRHFTELWTAYGLERRKWSEDPEVIRNSPVIRFTPASPDDLERICCDSFFLPEYGALIDIGDQYSTKALIENLNALGYSLDAIHSIYLTHTHADHFGRPELFVNKDGPIPVLTSVEEFNSYMKNPLNALNACVCWKMDADEEENHVGRQALLAMDSSKYAGQLMPIDDNTQVNGISHRQIQIEDLEKGPLPEGEMGYVVLPGHHSSGDMTPVLGNFVFCGDIFSSTGSYSGNRKRYLSQVGSLKGLVMIKSVLSKFAKIIPGHCQNYFHSKGITRSGENIQYAT